MTSPRTIRPSDIKAPTGYLERFQQEQHRRQHLEGRVAALELERDALAYRLQTAQAEIERLKAAACPPRSTQAQLRAGA